MDKSGSCLSRGMVSMNRRLHRSASSAMFLVWGLFALACSGTDSESVLAGSGGFDGNSSTGGAPGATGGGLGFATGGSAVGSGGAASGSGGALGDTGGTGAGAEQATGGESATGGASTGGTASGGTATGGETAAGGTATGGETATGGNSGLPEPSTNSTFSNLSGWHIAPKSDLTPGATAVTTADAGASDNAVLRLTIPGNPGFSSGSYAGPGAHAIEVVKDGGTQLYGRYEFDVSFPSCGADEELVSGLFTYFNNGSDADGDNINDNSEIDIEHLCGDPQILWLTVWTDYEESPTTAFQRSSRAINMRTGAFRETAFGNTSFAGAWTNGTLPGLAVANFPAPSAYYTLGFEWTENTVRYFMIDGDEEIDLYTVSGKTYVPQRPAELLLNFWHSSTQWWDNTTADFPKNNAVLSFDAVRVWTVDQL